MPFHSCELTVLTQVIIVLCCVPLNVGAALGVAHFLNIYKIEASVIDVHETVLVLSGMAVTTL